MFAFCGLPRTSEKLEEASTKLLLEEQQNRALLSTLGARPVVECPCVGSLHKSMVLNRTLIPRENTVVPTAGLPPSSKRVEIYLTKVSVLLFSFGFRVSGQILTCDLIHDAELFCSASAHCHSNSC